MTGVQTCALPILIQESMAHLEDGDVFDLQRELRERLEESRRRIRIYEGILRVGTLFEMLAMAGVLGVVVWILR